jgi:hypothetical protein
MFLIYDEYLYIASGVLIVITSVIMFTKVTVDPIDSGVIIDEQAINLTSQFTNEMRDRITVE